jgi:hypothetical protein
MAEGTANANRLQCRAPAYELEDVNVEKRRG